MGIFHSLVRPNGAVHAFAVHTNALGEGVIHKLDAAGTVIDFTIFQSPRHLLEGLAASLGYAVEVRVHDLTGDKSLVANLCDWSRTTWAGLAALLNRRPRTAAGHRAVARVYGSGAYWDGNRWVEGWVYQFIQFDRKADQWHATPAGVAWDAKHYPPPPPPAGVASDTVPGV